ncbi:phospholipase D zeta 1-like isoform X1 [Castanea sativa]|uniref:phospholipase D zeta 1-like isoform X1 n=1 Tax=Castanea sativa TaxID=21020 RepID=UPI003F64BBA3
MLRLLEMRFMEMMGGISLKVIRSRFYLTPFLKNKKMKGPSKWTKYYSSWTTTSCRWLPKLSFLPEYGPKLKEDYVMVKHLPKILKDDDDLRKCCACCWFSCCNDNWQKVWAVLKPGFLALLEDPFHTQPLDITVFDVLPASDGNGEGRVSLAKEIKERNPLRHAFKADEYPTLFLYPANEKANPIKLSTKSGLKELAASINKHLKPEIMSRKMNCRKI